jgi:hypothetical protein
MSGMEHSYIDIKNIQEDRNYGGGNDYLESSSINSTVMDITGNLEKNGIKGTNVLKYYNTISASDFDKFLISKQQQSLHEKSTKATAQSIKNKENEKFYNLSLKNLAQNTSKTMIDIMNDMVIFFNSYDKNFGKLFDILTRNDRMIYVGLVLILISMILYFITVTA